MEALGLPEKVASPIPFRSRIPKDGADLQRHPSFAELHEPARTQRILFAFLLREDELLQEVAMPVGDQDRTGGRHETSF